MSEILILTGWKLYQYPLVCHVLYGKFLRFFFFSFFPSSIFNSIAAGGVMDVNTALPEVLKTALIHDGLARGIREAAKALDKYVKNIN